MARRARLTLADAEEILRLGETRQRARRRWGRNAGEVFDRMAAGLRSHAEAAYEHLLTLPLPDLFPVPEDRERAEELLLAHRLAGYPRGSLPSNFNRPPRERAVTHESAGPRPQRRASAVIFAR